MRMLAIGLTLGIAFGFGGQAMAGYMRHSHWVDASVEQRLSYAAGVADALQTIADTSQELGNDRTIAAVKSADKCTDSLKLGELVDMASQAIQDSPSDTPSTAIFASLVECK